MDTKWRERVLEVYGRREDDFPDADSYNDYVEKREDLSAFVCVCAVWCLHYGCTCANPTALFYRSPSHKP